MCPSGGVVFSHMQAAAPSRGLSLVVVDTRARGLGADGGMRWSWLRGYLVAICVDWWWRRGREGAAAANGLRVCEAGTKNLLGGARLNTEASLLPRARGGARVGASHEMRGARQIISLVFTGTGRQSGGAAGARGRRNVDER